MQNAVDHPIEILKDVNKTYMQKETIETKGSLETEVESPRKTSKIKKRVKFSTNLIFIVDIPSYKVYNLENTHTEYIQMIEQDNTRCRCTML